ncbi:MAG: hypothetical protein L0J08_07960 [Micrococcaceae bacterium]|uniref:hypothetical protein n=1 Tax=Arthrobacter rhombi TaxID=71253 RepID=UPI002652512C|nr:hypothetical protein [Micrococcaceae bacterium]MDN5812336.1 hypothetical protein [Micrococcaceae bacterium]MDN5823199.1 hypothetical protein [Micrococcaceae bacterium]MDN5879004.1 hypothetical protein [Micrococcaceae bacterium]MDN5887306.1 hypothetical protein [Micrococcaceae bacterium]
MRVPTKTMAGISALGLSAVLLGSSPAAAAEIQAISHVSGSQSCPSGYWVYIQGEIRSGTATVRVNGKNKGTYSIVVAYNTKLRSANWSVSGSNLGTVSDSCVKDPFAGGGGGGNFSLDPQ